MDKRKIIIDTDIGDDIDDAFAITFALNSPEIEVVGLTTVFRNAKKRAEMCAALLDSLNQKQIPVFAGIDQPLISEIRERKNDHYDSLGNFVPCQYDETMSHFEYKQQHAVDFIINSIRNNPNQITLVPIGPLTNIAIAIRQAPEIIDLVKEIVLMGGYYSEDIPEWNILCDPEAARIVFSSGAKIKAVGLDVTLKCELNGEYLDDFKKLSSRTSKLLSNMMDKWFEHYQFSCPILHDPLTIGTLIDEQFVTFELKNVTVSLDKEHYGKTIIKDEIKNNITSVIQIASKVENKKYLEFFKNRVFN